MGACHGRVSFFSPRRQRLRTRGSKCCFRKAQARSGMPCAVRGRECYDAIYDRPMSLFLDVPILLFTVIQATLRQVNCLTAFGQRSFPGNCLTRCPKQRSFPVNCLTEGVKHLPGWLQGARSLRVPARQPVVDVVEKVDKTDSEMARPLAWRSLRYGLGARAIAARTSMPSGAAGELSMRGLFGRDFSCQP